MKKILCTLCAIIGVAFSVGGCKPATDTGKSSSTEEANTKTILMVQNQSSVPISNIKYCGKETAALAQGKTWKAEFTDKTQGYIYFDLGDGDVHVRTQETVITEKDNTHTFNITDNTMVVDKDKTISLSAIAKNFVLDGGVFLYYDDPETHEVVYWYFFDGVVYDIVKTNNTYKKYRQLMPMTYKGNIITFSDDHSNPDENIQSRSVEVKVTATGMMYEGRLFQRVTDPVIIQAIKDTPVSQLPSLDGGIFFDKEIADAAIKVYRYFSMGFVYFIMYNNNKYIKYETLDQYGERNGGNYIIYDADDKVPNEHGLLEPRFTYVEVRDEYMIEERHRSPRVTDPAIIQAIKDAPTLQLPINLSLNDSIFLDDADSEQEKTYTYFVNGNIYSIVYKDNTYTKRKTEGSYEGILIDFVDKQGLAHRFNATLIKEGMIKKREDGYFSPRVTDPAIIQAIKDAPVSQP